ncbi:DUF429 domain-containing protein [Rhizobium sp. CFBP 13726]|uniref:DUF429 domain-containing protein n=1 Tax=Rhizobium sp. CFBP 13726 TaxID=2775296 RepID=UPI0020176948|nr:DUF429 domain-containing protein [Rhizobium sp. CFBP 13726]
MMRSVLGIDAAWTHVEPSGVALVTDDGGGWRLLKVASSYHAFLCDNLSMNARHRGSTPDPQALLAKSVSDVGSAITIVAIDMPLSTVPIVERRTSDNLISSLYGARHAGTHSPTALRPGKLSDELKIAFQREGYPLLTSENSLSGLIEVYPHPALIELASAARRLPYKHAKSGKYWPGETKMVRRQKLFEIWQHIVDLLERQLQGVAAALVLPDLGCRSYELKAFEDALDAVVCAWVGTCVLDGTAKAYGDDRSAIWIPTGVS